jgi:MoxR-like ATPase
MKDINLAIRDVGRIKGVSALLLAGEPGVGKTHWSELAAQYWFDLLGQPVNKIFMQLYKGVEKEKLLYDYHMPNMVEAMTDGAAQLQATAGLVDAMRIQADPKNTSMRNELHGLVHRLEKKAVRKGEIIQHGVLYKAALSSHTQPTLLVLDELDKATEEIDVLLLDFLQNGRLTDPLFGEVVANMHNLLVIITSNEQRELNDALYRRLRYVRLPYPTPDRQLRILRDMDAESFAALGEPAVESLIALADSYRKKDVTRKVVVNQLARLMADLVVLRHDAGYVQEAIVQWFSPNEDDWKVAAKLSGFKPFVDLVTVK